MLRLVAASLCAGFLWAQAPKDPAAEPPAPVDQALRARLSEFFQDYVDGKFRQSEALVAEDSKDFYFTTNKPRILSFEIKNIDYSEDFTRAKAVVLCEMYVPVPGFVNKPLKVPVGGTWKVVDGQWYWYVDESVLRSTPAGESRLGPSTGPPQGAPPPVPTLDQAKAMLAKMQTQVTADKQSVTLKPGGSAQIVLANGSAGAVTLSIQGAIVGVEAKFDQLAIDSGGKATLRLSANASAQSGTITVEVEPAGQLLQIHVEVR